MPSLFVSHNQTDREFARRLAADLKLAGVKVWIDEAEMKPGDSLFDKLEDGIRETDYLGVVLSPEAVASKWVRVELNAALQLEVLHGKVKVLPLLFRPCDVPVFLLDKIHIDFIDTSRYQSALAELFSFLNGSPPPVWLTAKEAARIIKTDRHPRGELITLSQQGVLQQHIQYLRGDWLFSDARTGRSRIWVADYYDPRESTVSPYAVRDGEIIEYPRATLHGAPPFVDFNFLDSDLAIPAGIEAAQATGNVPSQDTLFFINSKFYYWRAGGGYVWAVSFLDVAFASCTCGVIINARSGEVISCEPPSR